MALSLVNKGQWGYTRLSQLFDSFPTFSLRSKLVPTCVPHGVRVSTPSPSLASDHSFLFLFLTLSSLRSRFQLQTPALLPVSFIFPILFSGQTEPFLLCVPLHWSSFFSLLLLHDLLQTKAVSAQQGLFNSCREWTLIVPLTFLCFSSAICQSLLEIHKLWCLFVG